MLARVVERLLDDAEQRLLQPPAHANLLADDTQVRVHGVALPELGDELAQRRHQAEVVERHRPEIEDQAPGVVENAADTVLEVGQLADHHLGVAGDEPLDDLGLKHEVRHGLRGPVVHVPGDPHPLLLNDLEDLTGGIAEPGGPVGRSGIGGEKVIEAPIDGSEHLLLGADAGEPGAELDLALLGGGQIGANLGEGAERAVDLLDVAGRQHAQQGAPAPLGLVLRGAQLLQAHSHRGQLVVERRGGRIEVFDALGHQESDTGQRRWVHGGGRFDFAHHLHHVTAESHPARTSQMAVTGLLHDEPSVAPSV